MLMDGPGDEDRRQEGEDVSLQKGDEQLQRADKQLHADAADSDGAPEKTLIGAQSDEAQNHAQDGMAAHDVGKQSDGEDTVLNEEAENFDGEDAECQRFSKGSGNAGVGHHVAEEAAGAHGLHAIEHSRDKRRHGQCGRHVNIARGRAEKRNGAEQVTDQDVEEATPQKREVLVGRMTAGCAVSVVCVTVVAVICVSVIVVTVVMVIITDGRSYHFIANEQGNGFPEVPEATFDRLAGLYSFGEATKYEQAKGKSNYLQHHELGDLQAEDFRKWNVQSAWQLEEAKVANMMERIA